VLFLFSQTVFCSSDARLPAQVVQAGAIEELIHAMSLHREHGQLQEAAIWALWTAAAKNEFQARAVASGATGAVITAMRLHPGAVGVQEQAIWCIYNLCATNSANRGDPLLTFPRKWDRNNDHKPR